MQKKKAKFCTWIFAILIGLIIVALYCVPVVSVYTVGDIVTPILAGAYLGKQLCRFYDWLIAAEEEEPKKKKRLCEKVEKNYSKEENN